MGFFTRARNIATVTVNFRDANAASVHIEPVGDGSTAIKVFCWYYARVLNNLGTSDGTAMQLCELVDGIVTDAMNVGLPDRLLPDSFVLLPSVEKPSKTCKGELQQRGERTVMMTSFSWGGEGYYSSVSVLALLEHIVRLLDRAQCAVFVVSVAGMNNYYRKHGWGHLSSINSAPLAGLQCAEAVLGENT